MANSAERHYAVYIFIESRQVVFKRLFCGKSARNDQWWLSDTDSYSVNRHLTTDSQNGLDVVNSSISYLACDTTPAMYRRMEAPFLCSFCHICLVCTCSIDKILYVSLGNLFPNMTQLSSFVSLLFPGIK